MAKRKLVLEGDETLRKKSREVTEFNAKLGQLLDDMAETMYAYDGAGLAAVQVGVLRRAVVIDAGGGLRELVNPVMLETRDTQTGGEGCLSFPDKWGEVTRPKWVKVKAQDRNGTEFTLEGEDLLARALCHELDHLDGVLFVDLADEIELSDDRPRRRRRRERRQDGN